MISILQQRKDPEKLSHLSKLPYCYLVAETGASDLHLPPKLQSNTTFLGADGHSQSTLGVKNTIEIILFFLLVWNEGQNMLRTGNL